MSRELADLHPFVAAKALAFLTMAEASGIHLLVTATRRTAEEQDALYAQGRTMPGEIVTNAQGGQTPHNFGMAFDVVPLDAQRQPVWNTPLPTWRALYAIAEKVGLDALGDKWGEYVSWDPGHFQEPGWKILRDAGFFAGWAAPK